MAKRTNARSDGDAIPDEVLDHLYGSAPEDFTARRNAAAKELKQAGDDEAAKAVRALRRPSAPAAAINRAVRAEPEQARALLDAARDMRRAHEAVIGGKGDRETLRAAVAAERQAVSALARTAATEARGDTRLSADLERRIRDTLEAVALDDQVRERFAAGRLERDARAATLAGDVPVKGPSPAKRKRRADDEEKRRADEERRRLADALRDAQRSVDRTSADVERAERARKRADSELRDARERLKAARAELRSAQRAAEKSR